MLNGCSISPFLNKQEKENSLLIYADRVFDGHTIKTNTAVLITGNKIARIDSLDAFHIKPAKIINLGDATLLPGFIELHAHLSFKNVPAEIVLKHGITTIRDLGGPIHQPFGGDGRLRILTSGPIITAPNGYPIPIFGSDNVIPVSSESDARQTVRSLIKKGAVVIKIALEPGGEKGAPWASGHEHEHQKITSVEKQWPLLSEDIVTAIVDEAHKLNRKVTAHIGEAKGAEISINSGVDEWAHVPCAAIPKNLLKKAVNQQIKIVSTIDTLSKCSGIFHNIKELTSLGAEFLYGAEIAHKDIPWGIDAQELFYLKKYAKLSPLELLQTITSKAGQHLNRPQLGSLKPGAHADIIAVKGNPLNNLKRLEYPDLVISGGKIILDNF